MESYELQIQVPHSVFDLTSDVINHGLIYLLIPPPDLVRSWSETDLDLFGDDEHKEKFLKDIYSQVEPTDDDILQDSKLTALLPIFKEFGKVIAEKVGIILISRFLPLFTPEDNFKITKKGEDLYKEIDDIMFDLLVSIQLDLETESGKAVIKTLRDVDDDSDKIVEKMMKKHRYPDISLRVAKDKLTPVILSTIDVRMKEFVEYMEAAITNHYRDLVVKDKTLLSEPEHLE